MKQILLAGTWHTPNGADAQAVGLTGGQIHYTAAPSNYIYFLQPFSEGGVLRNLKVQLDVAPGVGKKWRFEIWRNYAATGYYVEIADNDTYGENLGEYVVDGPPLNRRLCMVITPTGNPSTMNMYRYIEFETDTMEYCVIPDTSGLDTINQIGYWYNTPQTPSVWIWNADEQYEQNIMPLAGIITNQRWHVEPSSLSGACIYGLSPRRGFPSAAIGPYCNITAGNDSCEDFANPGPISQGEEYGLRAYMGGAILQRAMKWGHVFIPDQSNWFPVMAHTRLGGLIGSNPAYNGLMNNLVWQANENNVKNLMGPMRVKYLYFKVGVPPGAGASWTMTVRKNGADTPITATISGAVDQIGSNLLDTVDFADLDFGSVKFEYTGVPANPLSIAWSVAASYLEGGGPGGKGINAANRLVGAGII